MTLTPNLIRKATVFSGCLKLSVRFHTNFVGLIQITIYCIPFIKFKSFGCLMYWHLIWLPVNRSFNFTNINIDVGIKKLGETDLNIEIYICVKIFLSHVWSESGLLLLLLYIDFPIYNIICNVFVKQFPFSLTLLICKLFR